MLIVLGLLVSLTGIAPLGGVLANIGWLLLIVGLVLTVLSYVMGSRPRVS